MVTKSVAIRYINQEIDRKVRQFISIYAEDQAIDRLNTEDIITILINNFSNSLNIVAVDLIISTLLLYVKDKS